MVVEQKEVLTEKVNGTLHNTYHMLRDYATMANALTFFGGNSTFRDSVMSGLENDSACLGWGDASNGEDKFITPTSQQGIFTIPNDYARNLSTLSGITENTLAQLTHMIPTAESNVHYVTFLMSDGDNMQWLLSDFASDSKWWGNSHRGTFNMGWGIPPSLIDLAPSVMKWYYESASKGTYKDYFVVGPSGNGYMYPSKYPSAELDLHIQRLNDYMGRADINIVEVIDFDSLYNTSLWDKYTVQPNIDALIYLEYTNHKAHNGTILWSNNKPVITPREMLWDGIAGCDETTVINNINSAPRNPYSSSGYTLVLVNAWSKSMDSIKTVIDGLNSDVRVVTPEVFVKLIQTNLTGSANLEQLSYGFERDTEGWVGGTSGKQYDSASWSSIGNPGGSLVMDGSDLGYPDSNPNAWFYKKINLPSNATTLTFETRSADASHGGKLRVRVIDSSGTSHTLLDWETVKSDVWVLRSADISAYAGQTVTFYFEQNDNGEGSGEHRYVDNFQIFVK